MAIGSLNVMPSLAVPGPRRTRKPSGSMLCALVLDIHVRCMGDMFQPAWGGERESVFISNNRLNSVNIATS